MIPLSQPTLQLSAQKDLVLRMFCFFSFKFVYYRFCFCVWFGCTATPSIVRKAQPWHNGHNGIINHQSKILNHLLYKLHLLTLMSKIKKTMWSLLHPH